MLLPLRFRGVALVTLLSEEGKCNAGGQDPIIGDRDATVSSAAGQVSTNLVEAEKAPIDSTRALVWDVAVENWAIALTFYITEFSEFAFSQNEAQR
jgi:hypothetical protein